MAPAIARVPLIRPTIGALVVLGFAMGTYAVITNVPSDHVLRKAVRAVTSTAFYTSDIMNDPEDLNEAVCDERSCIARNLFAPGEGIMYCYSCLDVEECNGYNANLCTKIAWQLGIFTGGTVGLESYDVQDVWGQNANQCNQFGCLRYYFVGLNSNFESDSSIAVNMNNAVELYTTKCNNKGTLKKTMHENNQLGVKANTLSCTCTALDTYVSSTSGNCVDQPFCGRGEFMSPDLKTSQRTCSACPDNRYENRDEHRSTKCPGEQPTCAQGEYISRDTKTASRACSLCPSNQFQTAVNHRQGSCILAPDLDCNGHGQFDQTTGCVCDNLWIGIACQFSDVTTCSGAGTVSYDGICNCDGPESGVGRTCSEYSNSQTCNDSGTVSPDGDCTCNDDQSLRTTNCACIASIGPRSSPDGNCQCLAPETGVGPECQFTNKGTCTDSGIAQYDGSCICFDGHVGPACQYSDALNCNSNGAVQDDGSCVCSTGTCNGVSDPATCNGIATFCDRGLSAAEREKCPVMCNTCNESIAGRHAGPTCEYSDTLNCNSVGAAQYDGSCICERPLLGVGPTCNYTNANTCENLGIAQPDGSCKCKNPEIGVGPRCEFNNKDTCSNAGIAQFDGSCVCIDTYVGSSCQFSDEFTCNGVDGSAQGNGSCECRNPDEGVGPSCEFNSRKTCNGVGIAQPDGSCACFGPLTGEGPSCSEYSNARTCQNLGVLNYTSVLANPNKTDTGPHWCDWRKTIKHMLITDPTAKVDVGIIQCHSLVEGGCAGHEFQACSQRCRPDCLKELVAAKREEDNNMPLTNVRLATTQPMQVTGEPSTEDAMGLWFLSTSSVAPDFASDDDATGTYTSTNALADISTTYAPSTTSADGSTTNVPTTDWGWWSGSGGGRQQRDENVGVDNKPPQPNAEKYYSYNHADHEDNRQSRGEDDDDNDGEADDDWMCAHCWNMRSGKRKDACKPAPRDRRYCCDKDETVWCSLSKDRFVYCDAKKGSTTKTTTTIPTTTKTTKTATTTTLTTTTYADTSCGAGEYIYESSWAASECRDCRFGTFNAEKSHSKTECSPWIDCDESEHRVAKATATQNNICETISECAANEYEYQAPISGVRNRQCKPITPCNPGEYVYVAAQKTRDQKCRKCDQSAESYAGGLCTSTTHTSTTTTSSTSTTTTTTVSTTTTSTTTTVTITTTTTTATSTTTTSVTSTTATTTTTSGTTTTTTTDLCAMCEATCTDYIECQADNMRAFKVEDVSAMMSSDACENVAEAMALDGYVGIFCNEQNLLKFSSRTACRNALDDILSAETSPPDSANGGIGCNKDGLLVQFDIEDDCNPMAASLNLLDNASRARENMRFGPFYIFVIPLLLLCFVSTSCCLHRQNDDTGWCSSAMQGFILAFKTFDLSSDWGTNLISMDNFRFTETGKMGAVQNDTWHHLKRASTFFCIVGTITFLIDFCAFVKANSSKRNAGSTSLRGKTVFGVVVFEDVPQIIICGIYLDAVGLDPEKDQLAIVSLVLSVISVIYNVIFIVKALQGVEFNPIGNTVDKVGTIMKTASSRRPNTNVKMNPAFDDSLMASNEAPKRKGDAEKKEKTKMKSMGGAAAMAKKKKKKTVDNIDKTGSSSKKKSKPSTAATPTPATTTPTASMKEKEKKKKKKKKKTKKKSSKNGDMIATKKKSKSAIKEDLESSDDDDDAAGDTAGGYLDVSDAEAAEDQDRAAEMQNNAGAQPAQAVALFAYTAADDEEVSFDKGDEFVDVEEAEEGWLKGTVVRTGATGTFPANYVSMQNSEEEEEESSAVNPRMEALLDAADASGADGYLEVTDVVDILKN